MLRAAKSLAEIGRGVEDHVRSAQRFRIGLRPVDVARDQLHFESFEDYWGPVEDGGSRASAPYRELPRDAQESIRAEVRRRLGVFASGGRFLMEVDMLFAIGRR